MLLYTLGVDCSPFGHSLTRDNAITCIKLWFGCHRLAPAKYLAAQPSGYCTPRLTKQPITPARARKNRHV